MVGLFQLADVLREIDRYGVLPWLGVVVSGLAELVLIAAYIACGMGRLTLRQRVVGRFDVLQVSALVFVVAIAAGLLSPGRNTTALALLLPFGISYWLHGLEGAASESAASDPASSDEP